MDRLQLQHVRTMLERWPNRRVCVYLSGGASIIGDKFSYQFQLDVGTALIEGVNGEPDSQAVVAANHIAAVESLPASPVGRQQISGGGSEE